MSVPCTKELLLSLIEDIELIARELIENSVAPKQNRMAAQDHKAVTELLVAKDKELKETLKLAAEQGEVEKEIELVRDQGRFIKIHSNSNILGASRGFSPRPAHQGPAGPAEGGGDPVGLHHLPGQAEAGQYLSVEPSPL